MTDQRSLSVSTPALPASSSSPLHPHQRISSSILSRDGGSVGRGAGSPERLSNPTIQTGRLGLPPVPPRPNQGKQGSTLPLQQHYIHRQNKQEKAIVEVEEVWENQRGTVLMGGPRFSANSLLPTDRGHWSDESGNQKIEKDKLQLPTPEWEWVEPNWIIDTRGDVDADGWQYAFNFGLFPWSKNCTVMSYVRRRKWIRSRKRMVALAKKKSQYDGYLSSKINAPTLPDAINSLPYQANLVKRINVGRLDREKLALLRSEIEVLVKQESPEQAEQKDKTVEADVQMAREQQLLIQLLSAPNSDHSEIESQISVLFRCFDFHVSKTKVVELLLSNFPNIMVNQYAAVLLQHLFFYSDRKSLAPLLTPSLKHSEETKL